MSAAEHYRLPVPKDLLDRGDAITRCREWQEAGEVIVFTNGCFDLLHAGHVLYLEAARALGDRLVLGLNEDASVARLKGAGRPLQGLDARSTVLLALSAIDFVTPFAEDTPLQLIGDLSPDILCKGGDYQPDEVVGREVVEARGGRVAILPFHPGFSSTQLLDRIRRAGTI